MSSSSGSGSKRRVAGPLGVLYTEDEDIAVPFECGVVPVEVNLQVRVNAHRAVVIVSVPKIASLTEKLYRASNVLLVCPQIIGYIYRVSQKSSYIWHKIWTT